MEALPQNRPMFEAAARTEARFGADRLRAAAQRADARVHAPRIPVAAAVLPRRPAERLVEPLRGRGPARDPRDHLARRRARRRAEGARAADVGAARFPEPAGRGRRAAARRPVGADAPARGAERGRRELHAEAARVGIPERDQAPQRDPGRHLRVRPAGFLPLALARRRTRARPTSRPGSRRSARCASRSRSCSGSRARTRGRPRRRRRAAASRSCSSATGRCSSCASRCRARRGSSPK